MSKYLLLISLIFLISLAGCGAGSGVTPATSDLSGLEGIWEIELATWGEGGKGTDCYFSWDQDDQYNSYEMFAIEISPHKITYAGYDYPILTWSYDGKTLTVEDAWYGEDFGGGSGLTQFTIKIRNDENSGLVSYYNWFDRSSVCGWIDVETFGTGTMYRPD